MAMEGNCFGDESVESLGDILACISVYLFAISCKESGNEVSICMWSIIGDVYQGTMMKVLPGASFIHLIY